MEAKTSAIVLGVASLPRDHRRLDPVARKFLASVVHQSQWGSRFYEIQIGITGGRFYFKIL